MAKSAIYQITNTITRDFYVGSSRNAQRRRAQHWLALRNGCHTNQRLQRSWDKYGADAFNWRLLAIVEPDVLHVVEHRLLNVVFGTPRCLNLCPTPSAGMAGRRHTPETIAKLRAQKLGKKASAETRARMRTANPFRGAPIPHIVGQEPWNKGMPAPNAGVPKSPTTVAKRLATLGARAESRERIGRTQFKKGHLHNSHEIRREPSQSPA